MSIPLGFTDLELKCGLVVADSQSCVNRVIAVPQGCALCHNKDLTQIAIALSVEWKAAVVLFQGMLVL